MTLTIKPLDYSHLDGGLVRMMNRFHTEGTLTGDPEADAYLRRDPNAALLGLLFDQRVRAEYAFTGPLRLRDRLGHLDMKRIAAMPLEDLQEAFAEKPAVHRFTNVMAERTHALARQLTEAYDGNAANLWNDGADAATIERRVRALPGFGKLKAMKMRYVLHYFGYRDFSEA
ncbi:MAG: hypothetical protein KatS3mg044_0742 [Rhodothermaceae bacterium]|nr:MAG: hypothetical protein KatS3mg044_0742 [Rhodothermaceae bacterium]